MTSVKVKKRKMPEKGLILTVITIIVLIFLLNLFENHFFLNQITNTLTGFSILELSEIKTSEASASYCRTLSVSDTYILSQDIIANNTCFTITSNNIIIDGQGHSITSNSAGSGIDISGYNNITIKNVRMYNFTYGISLTTGSNITILNNTINTNITDSSIIYATGALYSTNISNNLLITNYTGIDLQNSFSNNITIAYNSIKSGNGYTLSIYGSNLTILNNNFYSSLSTGLRLGYTSADILILNNNITVEDTASYAVILGTSSGMGITRTLLQNNTILSKRGLYGIATSSDINAHISDITIINNSIILPIPGNFEGIYIDRGIRINISKNIINVSDRSAIKINKQLNDSFITQNRIEVNISGNSGHGIEFADASYNNTIESNEILVSDIAGRGISITNSKNNKIQFNNIITTNTFGYAYTLIDSSNNTFFQNNLTMLAVGNQFTYGIYLSGASYNNSFISDRLRITSASKDIYMNLNDATPNYFVNTTFNRTKIIAGDNNLGTAIVKWYLTTNISRKKEMTLITGANISSYNVTSSFEDSGNSTQGSITQILTEFTQYNTTIVYTTPHTINITYQNYITNSTTINLSNTNSYFLSVLLTLSDETAPTYSPIINQTLELGNFFVFNISVADQSNVTLFRVNDTQFLIYNNGTLINNTPLSIGHYDLNISVNDTYNNLNWTILNVTVSDTTSPLFFPLPQNQTIEGGVSFGYDINATDLGGISTYIINDSRFSFFSNGTLINTSRLNVGTYNLNISVNDSSRNVNWTFFNVTVLDTTAPTLTYQSPANGYSNDSTSQVNVTFTCNASDFNQLQNFSLYLTNAINQSLISNRTSNLNGKTNSSNWTIEISRGNYTWNCLVYDQAGLSTWGTNRTLKLNYSDTTPPTISILGPTTPQNGTNTNISLLTDEESVCVYKNETSNFTRMEITGNVLQSQIINLTTAGTHLFVFACNDTSNNTANLSNNILITSIFAQQSSSYSTTFTANITKTISVINNINLTFNISYTTPQNVTIGINQYNTTPEITSLIISGYSITEYRYYTIDAPNIVGYINKITLKIPYNESILTALGISESALQLFSYNTSSNSWKEETEKAINTDLDYIEVNITHLSTFTLSQSTIIPASVEETKVTATPSGGGGALPIKKTETPTPKQEPSTQETLKEKTTETSKETAQNEKKTSQAEQEKEALAGKAFFNRFKDIINDYSTLWIIISSTLLLLLAFSHYSGILSSLKHRTTIIHQPLPSVLTLPQPPLSSSLSKEPKNITKKSPVPKKPSLEEELEKVQERIKKLRNDKEMFPPPPQKKEKKVRKDILDKIAEKELETINNQIQGYHPQGIIFEKTKNLEKLEQELQEIENKLSSPQSPKKQHIVREIEQRDFEQETIKKELITIQNILSGERKYNTIILEKTKKDFKIEQELNKVNEILDNLENNTKQDEQQDKIPTKKENALHSPIIKKRWKFI